MNTITLSGLVLNKPEYAYEKKGEKFYHFFTECTRTSGASDILLCEVSEVIMGDIEEERKFTFIGEIRTRNIKDESGKMHVEIVVFINKISDYEKSDENNVVLNGYICSKSNCRNTPLGRCITDFIVASNRNCNKSDYIPSIAWERNAIKTSNMRVGTEVSITGRLQSREYRKKMENEEIETRVAYELSVSNISQINGGIR